MSETIEMLWWHQPIRKGLLVKGPRLSAAPQSQPIEAVGDDTAGTGNHCQTRTVLRQVESKQGHGNISNARTNALHNADNTRPGAIPERKEAGGGEMPAADWRWHRCHLLSPETMPMWKGMRVSSFYRSLVLTNWQNIKIWRRWIGKVIHAVYFTWLSKPEATTKSYRVNAPLNEANKVMESDIWLTGIQCSTYVFPWKQINTHSGDQWQQT